MAFTYVPTVEAGAKCFVTVDSSGRRLCAACFEPLAAKAEGVLVCDLCNRLAHFSCCYAHEPDEADANLQTICKDCLERSPPGAQDLGAL